MDVTSQSDPVVNLLPSRLHSGLGYSRVPGGCIIQYKTWLIQAWRIYHQVSVDEVKVKL